VSKKVFCYFFSPFLEFHVDPQAQNLAKSFANSDESSESEEHDDSEDSSEEILKNPTVVKHTENVAEKAAEEVTGKALCNKESCRRSCNRQGLNGNCVMFVKCVCWK